MRSRRMLVGFLFSIITNLGYSFQLYFFRSKRRARRAQRTSPAAGRIDGVASDSKGVLWQTTNPQRFGPHFGIRPVLDQTEALGSIGIYRIIFDRLLERVGLCIVPVMFCFFIVPVVQVGTTPTPGCRQQQAIFNCSMQ